MADRRDLQAEFNRINELYQEYDLQMRKSGASIDQRQKMRDMLNAKKERLVSEMGDDLQKLNIGKGINVGKGTISSGLKDTTQGLDAAKSRKGMSGLKNVLGKKLMGGIPLIGGALSAIDSGDASAAIPGLDEAESVGMSAEDEDMMLAEIQAKKNYANSPARMAKLKSLMKKD